MGMLLERAKQRRDFIGRCDSEEIRVIIEAYSGLGELHSFLYTEASEGDWFQFALDNGDSIIRFKLDVRGDTYNFTHYEDENGEYCDNKSYVQETLTLGQVHKLFLYSGQWREVGFDKTISWLVNTLQKAPGENYNCWLVYILNKKMQAFGMATGLPEFFESEGYDLTITKTPYRLFFNASKADSPVMFKVWTPCEDDKAASIKASIKDDSLDIPIAKFPDFTKQDLCKIADYMYSAECKARGLGNAVSRGMK